METIETTMSRGVAMNVNAAHVASVGSEHNAARVSTFEIQEGRTPVEGQIIEEESHEEINTADSLLHSAKDDGFEMALQKLADGEFDEGQEEMPEEEIKNLEASSEEKLTEDELESDENTIETEEQDVARESVVMRIKELEDQVSLLEERNKELFEKVKTIENNNAVALQTLLEMTLILQELLKDEEDEDEKISLLEALVEAMSTLMRAMFVPEDVNAGNKTVGSVGQSAETMKKGKKRSIHEVVQALRDKGLIRTEEQLKQSEAPAEHQPQAA